jgi:hypothetical protein
VRKTQRRIVVFTSLVSVLILTSALLLALSPAPLSPEACASLFAIDAPTTLDDIFRTRKTVTRGQWSHIYIRHSRTTSGNASTVGGPGGLGDHFLIGNGDGTLDGEIQIGHRWNMQESALPPAGARSIDPACVSICLVGDFDRTTPTPTQLRRLSQLVSTLQYRLDIPRDRVILLDVPESPAGIGRYFPSTAMHASLPR